MGSGLPGYVNFLSPPVPGGMRGGGGSRAPQPVTKISLGIPQLVWWISGGLFWCIDNIYLPSQVTRPAGGYIMVTSGPCGGWCNRNFIRYYPLFSRLWTWCSCHQLLIDRIFWSYGGNCFPPLLVYNFLLPIIISSRDSRPNVYSANLLCTRLCFISFMSTHPPPDKDKYKEEDDKDDPTFLINSAKFDIGRVTKVGSFGAGKWGYDNDYTELFFIKSLFLST